MFWNTFLSFFGEESIKHKEIINSFYTNKFRQVKAICKDSQYIKDVLEYCRNHNLLVILATNSIFPKAATLTRMSFVDLKEEDFDYITVYENSSLSKPNPMYYQVLLDKFDLKGEDVLMFGNNQDEDGIATVLGIKVYMVGDYVITSDKLKLELDHIDISQIQDKIKEYIK